MKILLFSIFLVLLLFLWPKNEAQMQAWNHFWAVKEKSPQEQSQLQNQVIQKEIAATANVNQNMYDMRLFRLQKKPLPGPVGETQFEYMLRRW
jgi:hypothetical protein